ncbi:hypothetical protein CKJ79_27555 [Vibrio coralliilyticus]|nr:hypothetical protein CKJ79_27555 [Vibrio coralliilyticus]
MPFLISVSFSHFKSPHGWRLDLILRARRLECGFYGALTVKVTFCYIEKQHLAWCCECVKKV